MHPYNTWSCRNDCTYVPDVVVQVRMWEGEGGGDAASVDSLWNCKTRILPAVVRAGSAGTPCGPCEYAGETGDVQ